MMNLDDLPPGAHTRRFVAPPVSTADRDLAPLTEALNNQNLVKQAWITGNEVTAAEGNERTLLGIALVVETPIGASDNPEIRDLIVRLDEVANTVGLNIQSWGFVGPETVEHDLGAVGIRIY